jgi:hypothetical protein
VETERSLAEKKKMLAAAAADPPPSPTAESDTDRTARSQPTLGLDPDPSLSLDLSELCLDQGETEEDTGSDKDEESCVSMEPKSFREIYEEVKSQQQQLHSQRGAVQQLAQLEPALYQASRYLERTRPEMGLYDSMLSLNTVIEVARGSRGGGVESHRSSRSGATSGEEDEEGTVVSDDNNTLNEDASSNISDSSSSPSFRQDKKSDNATRPAGDFGLDLEGDKENSGLNNEKRRTRWSEEERRGPVLTDRDVNASRGSLSVAKEVERSAGLEKNTDDSDLDSQVSFWWVLIDCSCFLVSLTLFYFLY